MALSASVKLLFNATQTKAIDLQSASSPVVRNILLAFSDGAAAQQANLIWSDTRTLAPSGTENLDLAGSLTDFYGVGLTFVRIKGLIFIAAAANTNAVQVTRPASNGVPWLLAAGDGISLAPGAFIAWADPSAAGVVVTPATGDLITVTNAAGGTSTDYDVVILGAAS